MSPQWLSLSARKRDVARVPHRSGARARKPAGKIGDITKAALVLVQFEDKMIS
jgi:hypothetical protein